MTQALSPRGPDGSGVIAQGPVAFGHRRLKIIDLSNKAGQPMVDPELGLTIVFNGCIYNYPELRSELEGKGYRFFSHGDTEVILKAYHAWGEACVERFHGMFAFAIVERDSGTVVVARDRFGIKPLYYAETGPDSGRALRFASSLPALLAGGDVDTSIDRAALHNYMSFHAVVPPPRTILNGVRKLPPATIRRIAADGTSQDRIYWQPPYERRPEDNGVTREEWRDPRARCPAHGRTPAHGRRRAGRGASFRRRRFKRHRRSARRGRPEGPDDVLDRLRGSQWREGRRVRLPPT